MPKAPVRPPPGAAIRSSALAAGLLAVLASRAAAQEGGAGPDFADLATEQSAANAGPGPRQVPGRGVPVPGSVSPGAQALIAASYSPFWNAVGTTPEGWCALAARAADATEPRLAELRAALGVRVQEATMGGVRVFVLTPASIPEGHEGRTVLNLHGGGYVYGSGLSGTFEATLMAARAGIGVVAVDDRMPPDAPYPAAVDDAAAASLALLEEEGADPVRLAVNGTSAGAGWRSRCASRRTGCRCRGRWPSTPPGPTSWAWAVATAPTSGSTTWW